MTHPGLPLVQTGRCTVGELCSLRFWYPSLNICLAESKDISCLQIQMEFIGFNRCGFTKISKSVKPSRSTAFVVSEWVIYMRQEVRETEIDTSLLQGTIRHSAGAIRALRPDNNHHHHRPHAQKIMTMTTTMQQTGPAVVVSTRVNLLRLLLSTPSGEVEKLIHF